MPRPKKAPQEIAARCHSCGAPSLFWNDYFCPSCGAFNAALYRNEHAAPSVGKALTLDEIRAEYDAAKMPFKHNPNYVGAEAVLAFLRGEPRGYQWRA